MFPTTPVYTFMTEIIQGDGIMDHFPGICLPPVVMGGHDWTGKSPIHLVPI